MPPVWVRPPPTLPFTVPFICNGGIVKTMENTTFKAQLQPEEMLQRGIFGGSYFRDATEDDLAHMHPDVIELALMNRGRYDASRNQYGVKAGQSYDVWVTNGWIFPEDPLGWFHWYCRYSAGRRHERDTHQIARYNNYVTRWGSVARSQLHKNGSISPVVRQGLLQWGIIEV